RDRSAGSAVSPPVAAGPAPGAVPGDGPGLLCPGVPARRPPRRLRDGLGASAEPFAARDVVADHGRRAGLLPALSGRPLLSAGGAGGEAPVLSGERDLGSAERPDPVGGSPRSAAGRGDRAGAAPAGSPLAVARRRSWNLPRCAGAVGPGPAAARPAGRSRAPPYPSPRDRRGRHPFLSRERPRAPRSSWSPAARRRPSAGGRHAAKRRNASVPGPSDRHALRLS